MDEYRTRIIIFIILPLVLLLAAGNGASASSHPERTTTTAQADNLPAASQPQPSLRMVLDEGVASEPTARPRFPYLAITEEEVSTQTVLPTEDSETLHLPAVGKVTVPRSASSDAMKVRFSRGQLEQGKEEPSDHAPETVIIVSAFDPDDSLQHPVGGFDTPLTVQLLWEENVDETGDPVVYRYCREVVSWLPLPTGVDRENRQCTVQLHEPEIVTLLHPQRPAGVAGHWAEEYILYLMAIDAAQGYPDGTFRPDDAISRQEFARMLVQTAGLQVRYDTDRPHVVRQGDAVSESCDPYITGGMGPPHQPSRVGYLIRDALDVAEWAEPYVEIAIVSGLMPGFADDTFRPESPLSRVQLAVLLSQAMDLTPVEGDLPFSDAISIPAWGRGAVAALHDLGIVDGCPQDESVFRPREPASRAEAARLLSRALRVSLKQ